MKWILSFDSGVGVLVAAGAWFCAAEPSLTLVLWQCYLELEDDGFEFFPHWQPPHTEEELGLTKFGIHVVTSTFDKRTRLPAHA